MPILNGKALAKARENKGWTQVQLSAATKPKIDVSTISRIERGKPARVRERTFRELGRALGVASESLCTTKEAERDVVKLRVRPAARNALTLVARRYRIDRELIVEIAPLLFFIVAEQSLQERQRRIDEVSKMANSLFGLHCGIRHLPPYWPVDGVALESEERSIKARDLFGEMVANASEQFANDYADDYDEAEESPFVAFLRDALGKASNSQAAETVSWTPGLWPSYEICTEEAGAIVGGDKAATDMILCGDVALHDLLKIAPEERVERAQAQYLQKYGQSYSDRMRSFANALGLPPDPELAS